MAKRGRKPKDMPAHDPDQYTVTLQRGRLCWHPDVAPAIMAWLAMQEMIHVQARADAAAKYHATAPAIRETMTQSLDEMIRALRMLSGIVGQAWRRIDWNPAVIRVMDAIDPIHAESFPDPDPAA